MYVYWIDNRDEPLPPISTKQSVYAGDYSHYGGIYLYSNRDDNPFARVSVNPSTQCLSWTIQYC